MGDGWNRIIGEGVHALRVLVRCGVLRYDFRHREGLGNNAGYV